MQKPLGIAVLAACIGRGLDYELQNANHHEDHCNFSKTKLLFGFPLKLRHLSDTPQWIYSQDFIRYCARHDEDSVSETSSLQMANFTNTAPSCIHFYMDNVLKNSAECYFTKRQPCYCFHSRSRLFVDFQAQNTPLEHHPLRRG
jgi:hypothetical protein